MGVEGDEQWSGVMLFGVICFGRPLVLRAAKVVLFLEVHVIRV
jgi:hypothetical protein